MRRRVLVTHRGGWVDPAVVFPAICRGSDTAFWLDSGIHAETGVSYLGVATRAVVAAVDRGVVTETATGRQHDGTIFDFLRAEIDSCDATVIDAPDIDATVIAAQEIGAGEFALGWVGWLGYELHEQTMSTGALRASQYPDAAFLFADRVFAFDNASRTVSLLALSGDDIQEWSESARAVLDACRADGGQAGSRPTDAAPASEATASPEPRLEWSCSDADYRERIIACQRSIAEGDAYQLCLTMQARIDATPDPVDTYLALRELSPTHHGGFIRVGDVALLSASPEQFLTVTAGGNIESKPIKGTRPRGETPERDAELRDELVQSEKERAENLMIVDLMRNDIGRVSETGSVTVPSLLAVESYAQVHQLVSTVRGRLRGGLSPVDAVEACFPAGSMTGAPKFSAVRLLDAIEAAPRGIYSGAFGYFGLDGRVELAMVIRSIILDPAGATVGAGGGITALSVPDEELAEAKLKAAALLAVLGLVPL